jgi:hypothetical protein
MRKESVRYPLLFTYRDIVLGTRFAAEITVRGRALMADEGDGWWMFGVNPGGLAQGGATAGQANAEFRHSLFVVLSDWIEEAATFEEFRVRLDSFFRDCDEATVHEWEAAVAAVRDGRVDAPLPRVRAEDAPLRVEIIERPPNVARQLILESQPVTAVAA